VICNFDEMKQKHEIAFTVEGEASLKLWPLQRLAILCTAAKPAVKVQVRTTALLTKRGLRWCNSVNLRPLA